MKTKLGPGLWRCRRRVRASIIRDRLLLSSFSLPHAYFYGNWRGKVPNIFRMREFSGSREGDPAGLPERRGPRPFTETGGEVPINVRKRFAILLPRGCRSYLRRRLRRQVRLSAEASAGGSRPLFDFRKEPLETLTAAVSTFGQPGLEQTQKTKSLVHMQRRVTPRALVRLMRARWEQISEAIGCHWGRQIAAALGNLYLACSALAASTPQRWRSSSSISAGFSTVWATSSRNNQR
jgi:hypothetical protein